MQPFRYREGILSYFLNYVLNAFCSSRRLHAVRRGKAQKLNRGLQHPQHQPDQRHIAGLLLGIRLFHDVVLTVELIQAVGQLINIMAQAVGGVLGVCLIDSLIEPAQNQGQIGLILALRRQDPAQLGIGIGR